MSYQTFSATPLAHARLAAKVARNKKKLDSYLYREKHKITYKMRLDFIIKNEVTFERYLDGWKAWGFSGCSLVDPQPTKLKALDAAIKSSKAGRRGKR